MLANINICFLLVSQSTTMAKRILRGKKDESNETAFVEEKKSSN